MKKLLFILLFSTFATQAQEQPITPTVSPNPFERNQSITITVQGSQINESTWGVTGNALYLWAWMQDANGNYIADCPTNGTWTSTTETNRLTYNSGTDTYTKTFIPQDFYGNTVFGKMCFLVKAKDGSGDKKTNDNIFNILTKRTNIDIKDEEAKFDKERAASSSTGLLCCNPATAERTIYGRRRNAYATINSNAGLPSAPTRKANGLPGCDSAR